MEPIKYTSGKTMDDVITEFQVKAVIDILNNNSADKNKPSSANTLGTELSDSLNADGYAGSMETKLEMPNFTEESI